MRYRNLSGYLKEKYGKRLKKICIDGGFSCPNRDGTCGVGGCIYCSERGSGEHINASLSITEQVRAALIGADPEDRFIVYFQNFTNTYADVAVLRERYDAALIDGRIAVLDIGTRPDCIDDRIAELIASYKDKCDVWVELGLQSASDNTAKIINRGYNTEVYFSAVRTLKKYGISVVTHIMIGLPGEGDFELYETVRALNLAESDGLKIHSVYVPRGTELEKMYRRGEYAPIEMTEYVRRAVKVLRMISPKTVIHRLTGDCPRELLVAPEWNADKNAVLLSISRTLDALDAYQGDEFSDK
jgi:radical SAM protein (TIGR01212 family)